MMPIRRFKPPSGNRPEQRCADFAWAQAIPLHIVGASFSL